ncbi:hypothetical protein B0T20DRAFT_347115 [Sordaria brevicollis]|uniref:Uncharacterized protein n=1 Tax=Sordaria brevicollis TaxID=83679 RepID=A0AAE0UF45_SORBR|nr:hypothetical protein B0T20DRAFT_347115 [Sordaria brevicollis]
MEAGHSISSRSMPSMSTQPLDPDPIPRPPSASLGRKSSIRAVPYDPNDTRLPLAHSLSGLSTGSYSPSGWPFPKSHQRQNSKSKLPLPVDTGSPVKMDRRETSPSRRFAQRSMLRAAASAPSRQGSFHESSLRNETFSNAHKSSNLDEERDSDETNNGASRASQANAANVNESEERPKSRHGRPESLSRASASSLASRPKTPFPFSDPDDMPTERPTNPTPHAALTRQSGEFQDPRFTAEYFETINIRDRTPSPEPLTPPRRLSVTQSDSTDAMYGGSRQVSTFSTLHEVDEEDGDHDADKRNKRNSVDLEPSMTFVQDTSESQAFADQNINLESPSSAQQDESAISARRATSNTYSIHQNVNIGEGTPDRGIILIDPNLTADLSTHNISRVTSGSRRWTPLPNIDSIRRGPKIRHHRVIPEPGAGGIAPARSGIIPPVNTLADLAILGGNGSGNKLHDLEEQDPEQQERTQRVIRLQRWLIPVSFGMLQVSIISFVASIAVFATRTSQSPISAGIIAWVSISTVLLVSSLATLVIGACALGRLRKQQTGEDPWIEMHRLARALPPRPPAEKDGDKTDKKGKGLAKEDKAATEEAWKKFADDQEQLRKYVEKLEQEILDIKEKKEEEQAMMHAAKQKLQQASKKQQTDEDLHPIGTAISTGDHSPDSKSHSHPTQQPTAEDCPDCPGSSGQPSEDGDTSLTPKAPKATHNAPRNSLIAENKPTYYHTSGNRRRPRSNTTGHQSLHRLIGPPTESTGFGVPASNSGGTIGSLNVQQHLHGFYSPSRGNNRPSYASCHAARGHGSTCPDVGDTATRGGSRTSYKPGFRPPNAPSLAASLILGGMGVPISETQSSILTELCEAVTLSSYSVNGSTTGGGIHESYSPLGRDEIAGVLKKACFIDDNNNKSDKGVSPRPSSPSPPVMHLAGRVEVGTSSSSTSTSSTITRAESEKTGVESNNNKTTKRKMVGGMRAVPPSSEIAPEDDYRHDDQHEHEPMPQIPEMAKLHQRYQHRHPYQYQYQYQIPKLSLSLNEEQKQKAYWGTFRKTPSQRGDVRGMEFFEPGPGPGPDLGSSSGFVGFPAAAAGGGGHQTR